MHQNCTCNECQRLDALPVRRHGIPHAKQATFLGGSTYAHPVTQAEASAPAIKPWESLPLFGTLEPDLFA